MGGLDFLIFAYGPAPGVELIPQFLALVAWAGMAVFAVLLAPLSALLRRLRKGKPSRDGEAPSRDRKGAEGNGP